MTFLRSCPSPSPSDAPLHPRAHETYSVQGKAGTLSRQFYEVMTEAGLVEKKSHRKAAGEAKGPGRSGKRVTSKISFHSLRHTTTTLLKNAGISPAIAEEFVGHGPTSRPRR